ncbi:MAG TPA: PH domain-containing protein [Syntrophaceticus sp.]|nr:PH domain-containing protein [Syntrophaceticus sp.]
MHFPAKVDIWMAVLSSAPMLIGIWWAFKDFSWGALILLILLLFFVWISYRTVYVITEDSLEIRRGPFSEKIPFSEITSVKRSRFFWPSGALSLDHLVIKYKSGTKSVSPQNISLFINELKLRCPEAEFPEL